MILTIWLKEIREELFTWKSMLWLLIVSLLYSLTSYLLLTNKELSLLDQTELLWLFSKIVIGAAFLVVTINCSSLINNEFEKETAESLFLTPLHFSGFIAGKILASITLWFYIFLISIPYIIVITIGTNLIGPFLLFLGILGTIGITGIILFITGLSLIFRSTKNTLTTSLIFLFAFAVPAMFSTTLKINPLAQFFAKINPLDNIFGSLDNVLVDYQLSLAQNFKFIFPLILFCLIMLIFLIFTAKCTQKRGGLK